MKIPVKFIYDINYSSVGLICLLTFLSFQVTEALTLIIKLAEYLAKLPKVGIFNIEHHQ